MSGHLLLGVVRIYSKKVDFLFHDCNTVLTGLSKAFASIQLTLPEDARKASVQSITLPNTFDLDALNLDDGIDHNGIEDIHLRSLADITLTDQIPVAMDHYVAISFDEVHPNILLTCITLPQSPSMDVAGFQDRGRSIQRESPTAQFTGSDHPHDLQSPRATVVLGPIDDNPQATIVLGPTDDSAPHATMPVEVIRDVNNDCTLEYPLVIPDLGVGTEPNRDLDQTMKEKDHNEMVDDWAPEKMPLLSQQHSGPSTSANSHGAAVDAPVGEGHSALNLMLAESPPNQQQQRRGMKRKQFFDEPIVLTNKFMRGALNNTRDILRKRKGMPSSTLGTWKLNNSRRKEHIFYQPLLTAFSRDLLDISKKEYICSKPHLGISEEDHVDAGIDRTPTNQAPEDPRATTPPDTAPTLDMEIERLRNIATPPLTITAHDVEIELNIGGDRSTVRDDLTSFSTQRLRSVSVSPTRTNIATGGTMQTPDLTASLGAHGLVMETPITQTHYTFGKFDISDARQLTNSAEIDNLGLSDSHQLINSAETEVSL
ncbi:hypothetical protein TanjilG_10944 [Lupinus angustifolius]|uniref:Rad21/Rec8-like protein N-terminal domain-containing protein n=1 Tax=Lupinus angustifolius TaxID=3871 RepID=A0A1J7HFY6_LUPAN|nr:hypothetical protein TanjilG_10944 [Lupinus angustifolius]